MFGELNHLNSTHASSTNTIFICFVIRVREISKDGLVRLHLKLWWALPWNKFRFSDGYFLLVLKSEFVRNSNITGCTKPSLYEFLSPPACFDVSNFVDQAVSHQAHTITLYHHHMFSIFRVFHFSFSLTLYHRHISRVFQQLQMQIVL